MPLGNVIGSPSLKNELISGWENPEANRWDKSTSRLAGVVDEGKPRDLAGVLSRWHHADVDDQVRLV